MPKKRPRTTCPTCGTQLSQAALKRHRGRRPCVERYHRQRLAELHSLSPGVSIIQWPNEDRALQIARDAGVPPEHSPIRQEIVWTEHSDKPVLHYVAPTWVVLALNSIQDHLLEITIIENMKKRKKVDESIRPRLEAEINTVMFDASTILRSFDHEAQLGLSAAMAMVKPATVDRASRSTDAGREAWRPVREMLRRFASEALGGA